MDLPEFKYNPDAVALGIIKKEPTHCPVCAQDKPYVYVGHFYCEDEVEGICPWCIKDGSAALKFDGSFQDAASCEPVSDGSFLVELTERTPGYSGWQQEQWLSHCGDFCAFKGWVGWKELGPYKDELKSDIAKICTDFNMSVEDLSGSLLKDGSMQGYLFQCVQCGQHRLTADLN